MCSGFVRRAERECILRGKSPTISFQRGSKVEEGFLQIGLYSNSLFGYFDRDEYRIIIVFSM